MARKIVYSVLVFCLCLLLGIYFWGRFQRLKNPFTELNHPIKKSTIIEEKRYTGKTASGESRIFQEFIFKTESGHPLQFALSLPENLKAKVPVLIVIGGLSDGAQYFNHIQTHGNNVYIGYKYPFDASFWETDFRLFDLQNAILNIPSQLLEIKQWITKQAWADTANISLLGFSLGAMMLPSVHHMSQLNGEYYRTSIMAYGGSPLDELLKSNLKLNPTGAKNIIVWLLYSLIYPMEPAHHLPFLKGEFLLMNGIYDKKIPFEFAKKMQELTPGPKTIVNLEREHMHPNRKALTFELVRISEDWMKARKALND